MVFCFKHAPVSAKLSGEGKWEVHREVLGKLEENCVKIHRICEPLNIFNTLPLRR